MSLEAPLMLILAITALTSWQGFNKPALLDQFVLHPYRVKYENQWYRLVTHAFIHANFTHLALNLFVLWQFGMVVQNHLVQNVSEALIPLPGSYNFFMLYTGGVLFAAIPAMIKHTDNPAYRSLGASGAVSAVLISYILLFPTAKLLLFFVIPMPAFLAGALFFIYEHQMGKRGGTGIAHDAHLWGGIYGMLFTFAADQHVGHRFVAETLGYFNF